MIKKLGKDSAVYGGGDFVGKMVAFFIFPIIAAALSPFAFGALELIVTSTALLGLVVNCGLNNALQRFYWDKDTLKAQRPSLVSTGLAVQTAFGIIAIIMSLFALPVILPEVEKSGLPVTWVGLLAALFLIVFTHWLHYLLDVTRLHFSPFKFLSLSLISRVFGLLLALLAVVYWDWGLDGMLGMQACVAFGLLPLALWMVRKDLTLELDRIWAQKLVVYGYPFIFVGLAYWLFGSMDRWMLASMSSVEETGIYSVAFRFASIVFFVSTAFSKAWSPIAIKYRTDNPSGYRQFYAQILLLLFFVMMIIGGGLAIFSGEIIKLIMPSDYVGSALPLAILCFGVILQATLQVTAIGISLEKKTYLFARLSWLTALINLGLNWILIPEYGAVGAALATSISYLILTGTYLFWTQRLHTLPISWKSLSWLLFLSSLLAAMAIYANHYSFSWEILGFKVLLLTVCACLGWLALPIKDLKLAR